MADKKISQLDASATPLAGTEVLPIVQSGVTKKVATDDLTVKNLRSNATTGILQMVGVTAGQTRVVTVPDANFTAARTDAAQSFTGDQTLGTGNLIIGTAGKGIDFSADGQAAGMTSELLSDYEEGTCSLAISDGTTSSATTTCKYTRIGRQITVLIQLYNVNVSALSTSALIQITGMPFTTSATISCPVYSPYGAFIGLNGEITGTTVSLYQIGNTVDGNNFKLSNIGSPTNMTLNGPFTYFA